MWKQRLEYVHPSDTLVTHHGRPDTLFQDLEYQNSDFLRSANILVQPQLLQLKGRFLPRPELVLGEDRGRRMTQMPQDNTSWNLPGKVFDHAAPILSWAVIIFAGHNSRGGGSPGGVARDFARELANRLGRLGELGRTYDVGSLADLRCLRSLWSQQRPNPCSIHRRGCSKR